MFRVISWLITYNNTYYNTYNINIKDKELLKIVANLPVSVYLVDYQWYIGCHIDLTQPPMCHAI